MLGVLRFTSNGYGFTFDLNDDVAPMNEFTMEVDTRFDELPNPRTHGISPTITLFGKRVISCKGEILGDDTIDYWQRRMDIMKAISPYVPGVTSVLGTLTIPFDAINEDVTADVTLESFPQMPIVAQSPARGEYQIAFKAFDPRFYGSVANAQFILPTAGFLARTYPKTYPRTYGVSTTGQVGYFVTNSGNVETFLTGRLVGPTTSPQLVLIGQDRVHTWGLNGLVLQSTDYVDFDMNKHTAVMNGRLNVYNYAATSEWWALPPGTSEVRFTAFDYSSPAMYTIAWKNAYNL